LRESLIIAYNYLAPTSSTVQDVETVRDSIILATATPTDEDISTLFHMLVGESGYISRSIQEDARISRHNYTVLQHQVRNDTIENEESDDDMPDLEEAPRHNHTNVNTTGERRLLASSLNNRDESVHAMFSSHIFNIMHSQFSDRDVDNATEDMRDRNIGLIMSPSTFIDLITSDQLSRTQENTSDVIAAFSNNIRIAVNSIVGTYSARRSYINNVTSPIDQSDSIIDTQESLNSNNIELSTLVRTREDFNNADDDIDSVD
jgi:hypothetical protein